MTACYAFDSVRPDSRRPGWPAGRSAESGADYAVHSPISGRLSRCAAARASAGVISFKRDAQALTRTCF